MKTILAIAAMVVSPMAAQAATYTLDFSDPMAVCGNATCASNTPLLQSYGDVAGIVDVSYDSDISVAGLTPMYLWETGYDVLTNVIYGASGATSAITLTPAAGYRIELLGFDIAPYLQRVRDTRIQIEDFAQGVMFDTGVFTVPTSGVTHIDTSGAFTTTSGMRLLFGPDAYDVGIDNIQFSVVPAPVPLPASALLLMGAIAGFGALRRRA